MTNIQELFGDQLTKQEAFCLTVESWRHDPASTAPEWYGLPVTAAGHHGVLVGIRPRSPRPFLVQRKIGDEIASAPSFTCTETGVGYDFQVTWKSVLVEGFPGTAVREARGAIKWALEKGILVPADPHEIDHLPWGRPTLFWDNDLGNISIEKLGGAFPGHTYPWRTLDSTPYTRAAFL